MKKRKSASKLDRRQHKLGHSCDILGKEERRGGRGMTGNERRGGGDERDTFQGGTLEQVQHQERTRPLVLLWHGTLVCSRCGSSMLKFLIKLKKE